MQETTVDPKLVWGFQQHDAVPKGIVETILKEGWQNIPRVPVFEIPTEMRKGHEFVLADGHYRRNSAIYLHHQLPICVFAPDEQIIPDGKKFAQFRHSADPHLYEKLLKFYQLFACTKSKA